MRSVSRYNVGNTTTGHEFAAWHGDWEHDVAGRFHVFVFQAHSNMNIKSASVEVAAAQESPLESSNTDTGSTKQDDHRRVDDTPIAINAPIEPSLPPMLQDCDLMPNARVDTPPGIHSEMCEYAPPQVSDKMSSCTVHVPGMHATNVCGTCTSILGVDMDTVDVSSIESCAQPPNELCATVGSLRTDGTKACMDEIVDTGTSLDIAFDRFQSLLAANNDPVSAQWEVGWSETAQIEATTMETVNGDGQARHMGVTPGNNEECWEVVADNSGVQDWDNTSISCQCINERHQTGYLQQGNRYN